MPKTTVGAIITRPENNSEILLTRRNIEPYKGLWCLPGGHIETNEPSQDAVIREIKEETGLDFAPQFIGYFDEIIPINAIHAVVLVFFGPGAGTLKPDDYEVSQIAWFPLEEARRFELAFTHNEILDYYAEMEA